MGKCEVCGKGTKFSFPLCTDCYQLKESGKIVQCSNCNTYYLQKEGCPNCTDSKPESDCIICGEDSHGYLFCKDCYYKYKNKTLYIKVSNCSEFEIVNDEYSNLMYVCDDGRKVRSKSEKIISDFLFKHKIRAVYEKAVFYKENGVDKTLHPDFYLPDYDIYIEHNGYYGKKYLQQKSYSERIYREQNLNLIITTEADLKDIDKCLKPKLNLR